MTGVSKLTREFSGVYQHFQNRKNLKTIFLKPLVCDRDGLTVMVLLTFFDVSSSVV